MFRSRQKLVSAPVFSVVYPVYETNESGETVRKEVNQSEVELPDCSTTDISSLLAAGVEPQRVNTKILAPRDIVTDMSVEPEQTETTEQGE